MNAALRQSVSHRALMAAPVLLVEALDVSAQRFQAEVRPKRPEDVERMGTDPVIPGKNLIRTLITTGNAWIVSDAANERRFAIFDFTTSRGKHA